MLGATSSEVVDEEPAAVASGPGPATGKRARSRWLAALLTVAFLGSGAYVLTGFLRETVPPAGAIWFGTSFDPESFEVRGRRTSVEPGERFVMVARLSRPLLGSRLVIRGYLDDALITIAWTDSSDYAFLWGFDLDPAKPGTWRYEIAEIGGNALASGEFVAGE